MAEPCEKLNDDNYDVGNNEGSNDDDDRGSNRLKIGDEVIVKDLEEMMAAFENYHSFIGADDLGSLQLPPLILTLSLLTRARPASNGPLT